MTINQLKKLKETGIINIKALCEKAELNYDTIYSKMRRETPLSKFESFTLEETIKQYLLPIMERENGQ